MKVELEIPEWAIGKHIYVFADTELLAHKFYFRKKKKGNVVEGYEDIQVKIARCNGCGECCNSGFNPEAMLYMKKKLDEYKGEPCAFLEENGCGLGNNIPFSCIRSYCGEREEYPNCTEKMK